MRLVPRTVIVPHDSHTLLFLYMPLKISETQKPSRNEISREKLHIDTIVYISIHFFRTSSSFDWFFEKLRRYSFAQSEILISCERLLPVLECKCGIPSSCCLHYGLKNERDTGVHGINLIFKLLQRSVFMENVKVLPHPDDSNIVISTKNPQNLKTASMPKLKISKQKGRNVQKHEKHDKISIEWFGRCETSKTHNFQI